jgi:uncharacterized delta-60 repeat protein
MHAVPVSEKVTGNPRMESFMKQLQEVSGHRSAAYQRSLVRFGTVVLLTLVGCEVPADGLSGKDGSNGEDGTKGKDGQPGADGETGVSGGDGADGAKGVDGMDAEDGQPGLSGEDGKDGRDGRDGRDSTTVGQAVDPRVEPARIALSLTGHDRFFGVTYDSEGNIYATGQVSNDISSNADYALMVVKFLPNGEIDESFGNDGVAIYNVAIGGTSRELARGIVVQSTGKIVIAGAAEHDPNAAGLLANDTDIVLVRFNTDGTLDSSFGTGGVVRLDLNSGVIAPNGMNVDTLTAGDSLWALALAANDALVVHGTQRAEGFQVDGVTPRVDADWALLRLTAEGVPDATFSTDGKVTLDIGGAGASARAVSVLADGSIVATGYLNSSVLGQSTQQPVLYKVTASGDFDATFAVNDAWAEPGVWHDLAVQPPLRAEVYGAALQGDKLVTMGYGVSNANGATTTDWISLRYSADGDRDLTYGTSGTGATYLDAGGYSDNGRFVMVLPDNRVLGLGGGRPAPVNPLPMGETPETDGMIAILSEDGVPDESFGPGGFKLYDIGGTSDFFWAGATSPNQKYVAVVGIAGAEVNGVNDDDAALFLLKIKD